MMRIYLLILKGLIRMNKEFIKKMIQAEVLKYQAVKELLPNNIRKHIDSVENDAVEMLKELAVEIIKDYSEVDKKKQKETSKQTKKVNIDFS